MKKRFLEKLWGFFDICRNAKNTKRFMKGIEGIQRLVPNSELLRRVLIMSAIDGAPIAWKKASSNLIFSHPDLEMLEQAVIERFQRISRDRQAKEMPSCDLIYDSLDQLDIGFSGTDEIAPKNLKMIGSLSRASIRLVREFFALGLVESEPPRRFSFQAVTFVQLSILNPCFARLQAIDWTDVSHSRQVLLESDPVLTLQLQEIVDRGNQIFEDMPMFCQSVEPLRLDDIADYGNELMPFAWAVMLAGEILVDRMIDADLPVIGVFDPFREPWCLSGPCCQTA